MLWRIRLSTAQAAAAATCYKLAPAPYANTVTADTCAYVCHRHGARRRPSARSDNLVGPESAASRVQRVRNILFLVASA